MMTTFIMTLSLFWPLPREGLSRFSVLLKSVTYLHCRTATLPHSGALTIFTDDSCVAPRKAGRHSE
ncbi:hypothetical protein B2J39_08955 [Salmonella enterica]|nr:hypothetical protein [Salmonella enterica]